MSNQFCLACLMPDTGFSVCPHCGWNNDAAPANPLYLPPGTIIQAPYQVARVLGHGGFGITYLGWDANLQIKVAIKEYLPRDFATRDSKTREVISYAGEAQHYFTSGLEQFLDEARTLAKFQQHAGIVSVLTFFRAYGTGYMVMEYVEGETLRNYLIRGKIRLNWEQTQQIFMHIMDALRAVHAVGLLHRDIAPDNIYLCKDGRVKLLDFGAARQSVAIEGQTMAVFKPGFAPEEQYRESGVQGAWSDVYSVAASIYYCLTGIVPPDAAGRLINDTLKPPSEYGAVVPAEIEKCIMSGLELRASQRPHTIAEFQKSLQVPIEQPRFVEKVDKLKKRDDELVTTRSTLATKSIVFVEESATHSSAVRFSWVMAIVVTVLLVIVLYNQRRSVERQSQRDDLTKTESLGERATDGRARSGFTSDRDGAANRSGISEEELRKHQEAALKRFDERRSQDDAATSRTPGAVDSDRSRRRSLCSEWGATMGCNESDVR